MPNGTAHRPCAAADLNQRDTLYYFYPNLPIRQTDFVGCSSTPKSVLSAVEGSKPIHNSKLKTQNFILPSVFCPLPSTLRPRVTSDERQTRRATICASWSDSGSPDLSGGPARPFAQGSAKNSNIFKYFQTFRTTFQSFSNIFERNLRVWYDTCGVVSARLEPDVVSEISDAFSRLIWVILWLSDPILAGWMRYSFHIKNLRFLQTPNTP